MTKETLPTVKVSGKDYVLVKDRVVFFNDTYTNGAIRTELITNSNGQVVVKANVFPDMEKPERYFTAYSQETVGSSMINKTSALENCETSAVGRALAMMGIGVIESIASADEVVKAMNHTADQPYSTPVKNTDSQLAQDVESVLLTCDTCGRPAIEKSGTGKTGKTYRGIFCSNEECNHVKWLPIS